MLSLSFYHSSIIVTIFVSVFVLYLDFNLLAIIITITTSKSQVVPGFTKWIFLDLLVGSYDYISRKDRWMHAYISRKDRWMHGYNQDG